MPFILQHSAQPSRLSGVYHLPVQVLLRVFFLLAILSNNACAANQGSETATPITRAENTLSDDEITVVSYEESEYKDPLMGFNRAMFAFNDFSYRYVLIPVAKTYNYIAPQPVRTGVSNVFANIKAPIHIINHLLQWEPSKAGTTTARFLINTTVGIAGIFDPANDWFDLKKDETGFSDTLADYGSGYGSYLVLPFIGPSDLRSGTGVVADYFLNPIPYTTEQPDTTYIMAADAAQGFAPKAETYETLRAKSDDPYLFFRNMYLQGLLRDQQFKTDDAKTNTTEK